MSELKRCPFCGGKAEIVDKKRYVGNEGYSVKFVECMECGVRTKEKVSDGYHYEYCTDEEIAELWNKRKPMQNIVERLKEDYSMDVGNLKMISVDKAIKIVKEEGLN